jgi:hypothetical protein
VPCETQDEIDYYWQRLSAEGQIQECGWLMDRFGLPCHRNMSPMEPINRRSLLQVFSAALAVPSLLRSWALFSKPALATVRSRARPGDPAWPSRASWERLNREVGGRLIKVRSPLAACENAPPSAACAELFQRLKNPYFLRDEVGLTQSLGWVGAWTSRPSAYAVDVQTTGDVVAAVNFARENDLRLVVLLALQVDSKEVVNDIFDKALAAGGRALRDAQDHGFMYERAFEDPDGHIWEIFWMSTQAAPQ